MKKNNLICSNPKCGKEVKTKWMWIFANQELIMCSDACYMYVRYSYEEGFKKTSAIQYLQTTHPNWIRKIIPYLEDWEIKAVKQTKIEEVVRNAIEKTFEDLKQQYLGEKSDEKVDL